MPDLFDPHRPVPTLSLWEPWASLIVAGFKRHETRHWATSLRGRVAIHAAKKVDVADAPAELCAVALGRGWEKTRPIGCVVAVAELTACFHTEVLTDPRAANLVGELRECDELAGNYAPGRFAFRLDQVRPLVEPLPIIGRQGFFHWKPPADLETRLLPAVDHETMAAAWDRRDG